jgi:hypothetical protein
LRHIYGFHLSRCVLWFYLSEFACVYSCHYLFSLSRHLCFMLSSITKKGEIVSI